MELVEASMVERKKEGEVEVHGPLPQKQGAISAHGVTIVITQAFCPNGHNLVREDALFDGYPGITLFVETDEWSGEVVLSPIHGDHSKVGMNRVVTEGTGCLLKCPECEVELPTIKSCGCAHGGSLIALHLRPDGAAGDVVGVCNVLGCYRSRVMDHWDLLSEFVEAEDEA